MAKAIIRFPQKNPTIKRLKKGAPLVFSPLSFPILSESMVLKDWI